MQINDKALEAAVEAIEKESCHAREGVIYSSISKSECIKLAKAAIESYERAKWRPISEAPKDGTPVLVWSDENKKYFVASYKEEQDYEGCHWFETVVGEYYIDETVTHFQYLPQPPEQIDG